VAGGQASPLSAAPPKPTAQAQNPRVGPTGRPKRPESTRARVAREKAAAQQQPQQPAGKISGQTSELPEVSRQKSSNPNKA
jgi:hypothetical protein